MAAPALLLAIDLSPASRIAFDACWALAPQLKAHVVLLHAAPTAAKPSTQASELCRAWADELVKAGIPVEVALHAGPVPQAILDEARRRDVAMIVMGTHGQSGLKGWFIGSVAAEVLRRSQVPVLVTPLRMHQGRAGARPARCIVAAVDFSAEGDVAYDAALRLAKDLRCVLRLIHVVAGTAFAAAEVSPASVQRWEEDSAERLALLASRARTHDVGVVPVVHWGDPATAILAEAKASQAELIVVGTHGRSGLRRFLLGSVAQSLVQTADMPVLIVPDRNHPEVGTWWR